MNYLRIFLASCIPRSWIDADLIKEISIIIGAEQPGNTIAYLKVHADHCVFLNKVNPRSSACSSEIPSIIGGRVFSFDAFSWSFACLNILAVRPGPTSQGARAGIKTCYLFLSNSGQSHSLTQYHIEDFTKLCLNKSVLDGFGILAVEAIRSKVVKCTIGVPTNTVSLCAQKLSLVCSLLELSSTRLSWHSISRFWVILIADRSSKLWWFICQCLGWVLIWQTLWP